jgi:hypothetical protein
MNFGTGRRQAYPPPYEPESHASNSAICCSGRLPEIVISDAPAQYRESLQKLFPFTKFNRMQVSRLSQYQFVSVAYYVYIQSQMIEKTLLRDSSIILAAPTGSGSSGFC